jgi:hypothetical protein
MRMVYLRMIVGMAVTVAVAVRMTMMSVAESCQTNNVHQKAEDADYE